MNRCWCCGVCVLASYRKYLFALRLPGAAGLGQAGCRVLEGSAAALVRRGNVDTNTKCSVGNGLCAIPCPGYTRSVSGVDTIPSV